MNMSCRKSMKAAGLIPFRMSSGLVSLICLYLLCLYVSPALGARNHQQDSGQSPGRSFILFGNHEASLEPGERDIAAFSLKAKQALRVRIEQLEGDVIVNITDDQGNLLASFNRSRAPEPELTRFATETGGSFRLLIECPENDIRALYRITAGPLDTASAEELRITANDRLESQAEREIERNQLADAMKYAKQALSERITIFGENSREAALTRIIFAEALYRRGDFGATITELSKVTEVLQAEQRRFDQGLIDAWNIEGAAYIAEEKVNEALASTEKIVNHITSALGPDHPSLATYLAHIGEGYREGREYEKAEKYFLNAYSIAQKRVNTAPENLAEIANYLGILKFDLHFYEEAEKYYLEANRLYVKAKMEDDWGYAQVLANLGLLYASFGRYAEAERLLKQALEARKSILGEEYMKHQDVARVLQQLSSLYINMGEYDLAKERLEQAVKVSGQVSPVLQAIIENTLANFYEDTKQLALAEAAYKKAIELVESAQQKGSVEASFPRRNYGVFLTHQRRYKEAEAILRDVLTIRSDKFGLKSAYTADAYMVLADVLEVQKHYAESEELYEKARIALEETFGVGHPEAESLYTTLSQHWVIRNDIDKAITYGKRSSDAREQGLLRSLVDGSEQQKLRFALSAANRVDYLVSLHLSKAPKNLEAAHLAAEAVFRAKGRVLDTMTDVLARLRQSKEPEDIQLLKRVDSLRRLVAGLAAKGVQIRKTSSPEGQAAEAELEGLARELGGRGLKLGLSLVPVHLDEVREAIPEKSVLIEYLVYRPVVFSDDGQMRFEARRYCAFVLSRTGEPIFFDLEDARNIERTVKDFQTHLREPARREAYTDATDLEGIIFDKLESSIGKATHLIIAPDGELNIVPFAALMDKKSRFLGERFTVSYVTTGREILQWNTQAPNANESLVIANPPSGELPQNSPLRQGIYRHPPSEPVPFGDEQVNMLRGALPEAKILPGAKATEAALKACRAPAVLHILAHGFYLPSPQKQSGLATPTEQMPVSTEIASVENPLLRSGFFLAEAWSAGPTVEDGVHTALEASSLNLWGSKLVILSACESGLGDPVTAEGVFGLRRALTLAGAQSLLVSLWRVNGEPTRVFMDEYYRALHQGLDGASALAEVQRSMLNNPRYRRYRHPHNWAGFVFVGRRISVFPQQ